MIITSILLFVFGLDPSSGNVVPPASTVPATVRQPTYSTQSINPRGNTTTNRVNVMSDREKYVRAALAEEEISEKTKHIQHKLHASHLKEQ